jgi:hypothetical protein
MTDDAPITAYHGSPHDFEQFDTSKIGTGEGAQAYGHGLYFAESEPIAQHYRDALSGTAPQLKVNGKTLSSLHMSSNIDDRLKKQIGFAYHQFNDLDKAIDYVAQQTHGKMTSKFVDPLDVEQYKKDLVNLENMRQNKPTIEPHTGHMYEVHIDAHPDHFLDWDKPISEQSEHAQNAVANLVADRYLHPTFRNELADLVDRGWFTGEKLHEKLTAKHGLPMAAGLLDKHGLHGIKYFDAGSRGSNEQQTRNYVVFDHNRVKINRKYEQGGAITPTAPKHFHEERKKAWNAIPHHAEDVRQRIEKELNVPATISKSENGFGRSWYVRPQIHSNDEYPFVVRVSDHSANQRLHQVEARIDLMHSGPGFRAGAEPMRSDDDIEQQKNNAIEFAKKYAERNKLKGGGYIHKEDGGGITAYHGSPHDFEQFDTSKIGTGEGNQSYGHGLYFAEQEPVAKGYRDQLAKSRGKFKIIDEKTGEEVNPNVPGYEAAHYFYSSDFYDQIVDDMRSQKNEHIAYLDDTDPSELAEKQLLQTTKAVPHGHMYEVHIDAHPDHFLDWDKPLSEQSDHVQNAIKNVAYSTDYFMRNPQKYEGEVLYEELKEKFGDKKASQLLSQHGIHGIRYLDAGSRNIVNNYGGAGTRNYVVFDHNRVKVKRKYEQGGAIMPTAPVAATAPIAKSKPIRHNPAIVEHALTKVSAPPPALDPIAAAKRGRPL